MSSTRALYLRISPADLRRYLQKPELLSRLDVRVALADGRALDLGRGWEEIGCLLEGGISVPTRAPTVGDSTLVEGERAAWGLVEAERVKELALFLDRIDRAEFYRMYYVDDEDTQDKLPDDQTGGIQKRSEHLFRKLAKLTEHYKTAARAGEAMLIRITPHEAR